MTNFHAELARAYGLLREGKLQDAEGVCRAELAKMPRSGPALHLLGLIRKEAGDPAEGERLMRESIAVEPRRAEFRVNLANLLRRLGRVREAESGFRDALALEPASVNARFGLARALSDLGEHATAERECRTLLTANPKDAEAWTLLASTLREQNRFTEAEAAFRAAIDARPDYPLAHHNLGSLLSQLDRSEEALASLARARALGLAGFELAFNRARALLGLYRVDEAEQAFEEAVAIEPRHTEAQLNLARLRFMRGDRDFARGIAAAASANKDETALQLMYGTVLRRAGDLDAAEGVLRDLVAQSGMPAARHILAEVLHEAGRLKEAEAEALEAASALPEDPRVIECLVGVLLSRGKPEDAEPFIRAQRSRQPLVQTWLAYEATAARLLDKPLYRELFDYPRFVRSYRIEPPPGWGSVQALNAALATALASRHPFSNHPLDQSLRNGSQTARDLVADPDPAIQDVLLAFQSRIEAYLEDIGDDAAHPFTSRNTRRTRFAGAWSVQLRREGFHVNHFHPQGWISSAYYVSVPDEVADENARSGWLKFGEPRFPVPGALAETVVKPQAGLLVLFPSYMWHGTTPIHGPVPRLTIAFDAVPAT